LEGETSTDSTLLLYVLSLSTPPPQFILLSPIDSPPFYNNNISQIDFHAIIRQQQKQLAAIQVQIQAWLEGGVAARQRGEEATKVAKPQIFDGISSKVAEFITACKLYIRMKLRGEMVEEQIQWILSYVQGEVVDVWKENIMEELKAGIIEYKFAEEFLTSLKK